MISHHSDLKALNTDSKNLPPRQDFRCIEQKNVQKLAYLGLIISWIYVTKPLG